jgi:phosphoribosylformylglycinamidine cyclo-ligase
MVADDLVVCGAEPLYLTDYIACGKVNPAKIAQIVKGVADGCRDAGCALIGGETAEHPGLLEPDQYDLAGAATGVVEKSRILGSAKVAEEDIAIGLTSSGLHSNGYSLARKVFFELSNWDLTRHVDDLGRTLGEELLEPTTIYSLTCLALMSKFAVRAYAHITGGGLAANLQRVLPPQLDVEIDRSSWSPAPIFELIGSLGNVAMPELERALNMGIGMVAIIAPEHAAEAVNFVESRGVAAFIIGHVVKGSGLVNVRGAYKK